MIRVFSFLILFLSLLSCQAQSSFKELARQIDNSIPKEYLYRRNQLLKDGVELSSFLPKNHSKKGDIDYTVALQKGIDKGGVLLLPDYPLLINKNGLSVRSNTKLVFRDNSKLIMKSNLETHYTVIELRSVNNVEIYSANIEGDRDKHQISKGEWGMGIRIQGSQNVNIYAPSISNCWGDGIYIAPIGNTQSENIMINNFKIYRARRNGISIISVNGLTINNGLISETYGTAPQSALDIEPNKPSNILNNILIKNLITHNSAGDGIMMALSNLTLQDDKDKVRVENKKITIRIENHKDIGSLYSARINGREEKNTKNKFKKGKLGGEIVFVNPVWSGYKDNSPLRFSPKKARVLSYGFNPNVKFSNITLLNNQGAKDKKSSILINSILEESKKL